ncbi:endonuclease/exonuclease/phosphatase family protein [Acuticoccus sp. M5D2P5]|uniref:endonuclease/exonuclease/phosphatase family protein n=1 Tax=Acuticoccus kalidii TaxID=2910977 RepID=UPI001F36FD1A|nr:endonuclease/exonuclease/phosphatase family protein [Acuticoccus kalidii]MCF3936410.1 endonuclease/exonuclease/phosphatase family protein [Acuticoccus kalidii]
MRIIRAIALLAAMSIAAGVRADPVDRAGVPDPAKAPGAIRFATFNTALSDDVPGGLVARLSTPDDPQARLVAETIQNVRPDVLVLQEIDRDREGATLDLFARHYLAIGQRGAAPIDYPHRLFPPTNSGVLSGVDLDGDGRVERPGDAKGFGRHDGHYGFAILSRHPFGPARTYADFLWSDLPGGLFPAAAYPAGAAEALPLSSKTHIVVPVSAGGRTIHLLAAHPTPPVFDEPTVDRNGRRNFDEIRLLADLLDDAAHLVDDDGVAGGVPPKADVVVAGDFNADPARGEARPGAIAQLLTHPRLRLIAPRSAMGEATADFGGGLRVDYVLPGTSLTVTGAGVFWPLTGPAARLVAASDHRLVFVDVTGD